MNKNKILISGIIAALLCIGLAGAICLAIFVNIMWPLAIVLVVIAALFGALLAKTSTIARDNMEKDISINLTGKNKEDEKDKYNLENIKEDEIEKEEDLKEQK